MQAEAIKESVRILQAHEQSDTDGLPRGQARGRIILPCGTGKTRIALRIVERLTPNGRLAIVLCPSIALVAQIRREFLQHASHPIRALAVCSDKTAGYDPKREGSRTIGDDPTADVSYVSAAALRGLVTTDPKEIEAWIQGYRSEDSVSVIFGTYQSGHRIAEALQNAGVEASVLVCDEAHRTAGLRKRHARSLNGGEYEQRIRDFTICHDQDRFPARFRIYQTATPKVYDTHQTNRDRSDDWIIRSMDDESVFGVELYRKSYSEAVRNGWLSDYRIIALGINDPDAYAAANALATDSDDSGRNALTTTGYLRGLALALAMGGATQGQGDDQIPIRSCIAFMNTVKKSNRMARDLQTDTVRKWVQGWLDQHRTGQRAADFWLEHLDASHNAVSRDQAKANLATATSARPFGILNVGIFGEGTDSPSLNSVAFLEPRKSPIDVIQAVGRAMRTAPDKSLGYIICPILIPPDADPEIWLSTSDMKDGWQELGQILLALRAHDSRIEDKLADLLQLHLPKPPEWQRTMVAIAATQSRRIRYGAHEGPPGTAQRAVEQTLAGKPSREITPLSAVVPTATDTGAASGTTAERDFSQIISGKLVNGIEPELRVDTVSRSAPKPDGTPGPVDLRKSKDKARDMINKGTGILLKKRRAERERENAETHARQMLQLSGMEEHGSAIRMNLLSRSGLRRDRVLRDLNILESSVREASHHLRGDELVAPLNRHFGIDHQQQQQAAASADGSVIASLLMMNAAMLHQRISNGGWLEGLTGLSAIKNDSAVIPRIRREWDRIITHDFEPVLRPALDAMDAIEVTGKRSGLARALRHIAAEAERIAETYADMGADHAGPLFNRVMGNQASDGAFFTRPVAASITARLALDACGDADWSSEAVWRDHKAVDLACGSGTLLAALLTEMKRRAREQGADEAQISELQKVAVEDILKGLDINPVSLQLAASQLTAGNHDIRYRRMGLHRMPYGPDPDNPDRVRAGTLELLGQRAIFRRRNELDIADDVVESSATWDSADEPGFENSAAAVESPRIVLMNPPFTNRWSMGDKFTAAAKEALRTRVDSLGEILERADPALAGFWDRNSIEPLFVALAERCVRESDGVIAMINPTIALSAPSAQAKRQMLAHRLHIHTVLTCHQPGQVNLSQNTNINESIIVMRRHPGAAQRPPTRFINLDRLPIDEAEVHDLHRSLQGCADGTLADGWGVVSEWPGEFIAEGDWTAALWRSPRLARAAHKFATSMHMKTIGQSGLTPHATGQQLRGGFESVESGTPGSFPILKSKGADAQTRIESQPDAHWAPKLRADGTRRVDDAAAMQQKAGHLLITAGQRTGTARLTATAADQQFVGNGWMPVTGLAAIEAKTLAVFLNSTAGRLQLLRNPGRTLDFPNFSVVDAGQIRIPDFRDPRVCSILAKCWEQTREMEVPQFRDGECEVRRLWDEAVAEAIGVDAGRLSELRALLHREPHIRGRAYGAYDAEEPDDPQFPGK